MESKAVEKPMARNVSYLDLVNKYGLFAGFILLLIIMSFTSPVFLTEVNLINILRQVTVVGVIAVGMTFAIISAGIDLSVGAVLAFAGIVMVSLQSEGAFIAVAVALLAGIVCGLANGIAISIGKVQPFIVTLASMTIIRGITLILSDGQPISLIDSTLLGIGKSYLGPVPVLVVIFAVVILLGWILLSKMKFGRHTFAIGSSESASKLAGIKIDKLKIMIYTLSGGLAALAGILLTSRLSSASPIAGMGYELEAIAAVAIGGAKLTGGTGSMGGTLLGVLIVGVISNGMVLLDVNAYLQQVVKGVIIFAAVLIASRKK
ncbi:ABC transporter permease [Bacillus sp. V3-13]|uniref:ABC transporter permease n=1 Tax=Bacillus sp. V3-13 TaxID=2053728 RepID=UPI002152A16D|nr:ribose ABC transporter permease [Bacillus sp. V3-13]